jgi:hypothetical protein
MLENDIAARIGKHELFDDIATVARHVAQHEGGHAILHRPDHARGVTLLFREIAAAVGDDEAEIFSWIALSAGSRSASMGAPHGTAQS